MSFNYSQFVNDLSSMVVWPTTDARFNTVLPNIIDDAEQRIYRDIDLLNTRFTDSSSSFALNTRLFTLPSATNTFVVVERINVITPASQSNPDLGTRNPMVPASKEVLDFMWPSSSGSTVPQYFAMHTQNQILVGPFPDQTYTVEVNGTFRPAPLSASNTTTLLSIYLPDLFFTAACLFAAAAQKNFGMAADDPKAAITFESHYQELLRSAQIEEARKKFTSAGWSSKQPAPLATPPRN